MLATDIVVVGRGFGLVVADLNNRCWPGALYPFPVLRARHAGFDQEHRPSVKLAIGELRLGRRIRCIRCVAVEKHIGRWRRGQKHIVGSPGRVPVWAVLDPYSRTAGIAAGLTPRLTAVWFT